MKGLIVVVCVSAIFYSCNNESGGSTRIKLDSISNKIDTTLDKAWDSTKVKAKELKDKIEIKLEKRDSSNAIHMLQGNN
ncbi:MAG: hypothetical protein H0V91_14040 [Flavisolibacter sp.]|nr:hypothetical protein [Flavisolibacter sp.]